VRRDEHGAFEERGSVPLTGVISDVGGGRIDASLLAQPADHDAAEHADDQEHAAGAIMPMVPTCIAALVAVVPASSAAWVAWAPARVTSTPRGRGACPVTGSRVTGHLG